MAGAVTFDKAGFQALRKRFPKETLQGLKAELGKIKRDFTKDFTIKRLKGAPGLNRRTGTLARSLKGETVGNDLDSLGLFLQIGGDAAKYARIQEFGGVVKPKNAKMLTIPLRAAKTRAGVARGSARSFPNTWIGKSRSGKPLIWQRTGKTQVRPLFLLVPSVRLKPRLGFIDFWEGQRNKNIDRLNKRMQAVILQENLRG